MSNATARNVVYNKQNYYLKYLITCGAHGCITLWRSEVYRGSNSGQKDSRTEALTQRCKTQRCRSKLQLRKSEAEWRMLGRGRELLISSQSAQDRGSRRCAVQCTSLWSNTGQIIASSYAVAVGWGKALVMYFSALSEKGLYFRFTSVHSAEMSPCFCSACL